MRKTQRRSSTAAHRLPVMTRQILEPLGASVAGVGHEHVDDAPYWSLHSTAMSWPTYTERPSRPANSASSYARAAEMRRYTRAMRGQWAWMGAKLLVDNEI